MILSWVEALSSQFGFLSIERIMEIFNKAALQALHHKKDETKAYTILIVDDEEYIVSTLQRMLDQEYNVLTARSGEEAWDLIQNDPNPERIHLILSDQRMDGITGIEFLEQTVSVIPRTIRIILTGFTDVDALTDAINKAQIYKFIAKPFDRLDMMITVKLALEKYELESKNIRLIEDLKTLNASLEQRVEDRTAELQDTNTKLSQEITERKKIEVELVSAKNKAEEMNRLKSSFLANMSHEIRTPMNSIIGFASILKEELTSNNSRSLVDHILTNSQRLLQTINDILDITKLEANKQEMELSIRNVVDECRMNLALLRPIASKKGLLLHFEPSQLEIYSQLDFKFFSQILNNLVGNAIKFTLEGNIWITLDYTQEELGNWVTLGVKDEGVGISEDFQPYVFDEFKQESEGYGRKFEGTGLGLSITRRLIDLMDGEISVTSSKGKGTAFSVRFPALEAAPPNLAPVEDSSTLNRTYEYTPRGNSPRLLLVEDDMDSQKLVKLILNGLYQIETASSGSEALGKITAKQYDLILMDINLGHGMDGSQTAQCIHRIQDYEKVPIIAITAFAMKGDRERFLSAGFHDYIAKPYQKEELLEKLQEICS